MDFQRLFSPLRSHLFRFVLFAVTSFSIILFFASQPSFSKNDESIFSNEDVDFSFVVVGCNRVDKGDIDKTSPSTANIEQLKRTFKEVAELSPPPKFLFFAGDAVMGYTSDEKILESQLKGWRELYESSPLASSQTTLIPIVGNHETQNEKKISYEGAEKTWLKVMAPYLRKYAGNGPRSGGKDNLKTDQSKLTYSFDYKGTHFVILNTDPVGRDWSVPKYWIAKDLEKAKSRFAKHIFAIGHKPAYAYPKNLYSPAETKEDGLGKLYPSDRDEVWASLENNKAEAMLSAHNHVYYRTQPNGKTWQIIAGNGGSTLDKVIDQSKNNAFGFTVINVLKNNNVTLTSYGRDVPKEGYLAPSEKYPTTIRDRGNITWNN